MSYLELFTAALVTGVVGLVSFCVLGWTEVEWIRGISFLVGILAIIVNTSVCWYGQWYIRTHKWM